MHLSGFMWFVDLVGRVYNMLLSFLQLYSTLCTAETEKLESYEFFDGLTDDDLLAADQPHER